MKETLRHIWSLGIKEIVGIARDPLLLALIVYSFTVSIYISAKASPDAIDHAAIAIVDEDGSALSKRVSDAFLPPLFQKPAKLSRADIDRVLDQGKYTFVVVFPPDFQEKVLANNDPEVQVNVDATRMSQAFTGNGYIQSIILKEVNAFVQESTEAQQTSYTAEALIRNRFNPNLTKSWEGALSQLINNIAMIALILTGAALIRERERGTLEHLMVTPVNPVEIMIAKVWSMSLVVLAATGVSLAGVIQGLLAVPVAGSFWLFMFGVLINLFAMTSLGIFLSCFAKDMPQLGILMILVLMPMQILSGGTTSQANMPEAIQAIMLFAPTTYFVEFSDAILFRGADFSLVWKTFVEMLLLGSGYFLIALKRFRKTVAS
ncbi:MAG: ABC transporter permease [Lentisphaeria bacterium]|nr:ABC transporter permease [Lentisphaeria bacterium]